MVQQTSARASDTRVRLFGQFFVNHERVVWKLSDIDWDNIDTRLLEDHMVEAVRAAMLVESHNPVYSSVLLTKLRLDFAATDFLAVWTYEEFKHFAGLRAYLEATNSVPGPEMKAELEATRAGEWTIPNHYTDLMVATYTMMQEHVTGIFYRNFAHHMKEPVLKKLLSYIGKDEFRHHQFYFELAQRLLAKDPSRIAEVDAALLEFQMPGPSFIPNYQYHALAMGDVGDLDTGTYQEVLGRVGKLTGEVHMHDLATNPTLRPSNSWLRLAFKKAAAPEDGDVTSLELKEQRRRAVLRRARLSGRWPRSEGQSPKRAPETATI